MWNLGRLAASKFRAVPLTARWRSSLCALTGSSPNVRRNPSSALSAVTSERMIALYQGSMVTNAIYNCGNKQQLNLAQASQKVNAEHKDFSLQLLAKLPNQAL